MKQKTAGKTKGHFSYVKVADFGENGIIKKMQVGWKPKALAGSQGKISYGAHKPKSLKIHEVAQATILPGSAFVALGEPNPADDEERESMLAEKLVTDVADSCPDVGALCDRYHLRREELGRLTGFSLRALADWAAGSLPSQPAKRRLQEVRRLLDALAEIVKRESLPQWLHQPNPAFDRLTPLQVIELGEIDRLWAMVHDLGSGQPD